MRLAMLRNTARFGSFAVRRALFAARDAAREFLDTRQRRPHTLRNLCAFVAGRASAAFDRAARLQEER